METNRNGAQDRTCSNRTAMYRLRVCCSVAVVRARVLGFSRCAFCSTKRSVVAANTESAARYRKSNASRNQSLLQSKSVDSTSDERKS